MASLTRIIGEARDAVADLIERSPELWECRDALVVIRPKGDEPDEPDEPEEAERIGHQKVSTSRAHSGQPPPGALRRKPIGETFATVQARVWDAGSALAPVQGEKWPRPPILDGRRRVDPLGVLLADLAAIDSILAWCLGDDRDAVAVRVHTAAGQLRGAVRAVDKLWMAPWERAQWMANQYGRRCKRKGCDDGTGEPRRLATSDGKVCRTCRKRDQRERERARRQRA